MAFTYAPISPYPSASAGGGVAVGVSVFATKPRTVKLGWGARDASTAQVRLKWSPAVSALLMKSPPTRDRPQFREYLATRKFSPDRPKASSVWTSITAMSVLPTLPVMRALPG